MHECIAQVDITADHDRFICFIFSHGGHQGVKGIDGKTMSVQELFNHSVNTKSFFQYGKHLH